MFDLKKNDPAKAAETGHEFEVLLPDNTKTGFFITVRGDQSSVVKNHGRRVYQQMKMAEEQAKRKGRTYDLTLEDAEEMGAEAAAVRVISWKGLSEDGKEVPFSNENALRVFKEHSWIREQVLEQASNVFNFRVE